MALLLHIFRPKNLIFKILVIQVFGFVVDLVVGVEADSPLALQNEINLRDIELLFVQVAILRRVFKHTRHETKTDLIEEISVEFLAHLEERFERSSLNDVLEQEFAHNVLLYLERNTIEIGLSRHKNCASVILPKVPEMVLYPIS